MEKTVMRRRQEKIGKVTGTKMQKTVVVTVDRQITHPLYKRVVRRSQKFLVHDEKGECGVGDWVRIQETRPLSARKRWRVVQFISRANPLAAPPASSAPESDQ
ncbi:MAG: 30S ribosomal protein S17 [Terriglobia bacterium]